jgi:hypothetical protein
MDATLPSMKSGLIGDDGRDVHDTAILTSALILFCQDVQRDMMRLSACGQDDSAPELFCAAAKNQLLNKHSRADVLQNIVERVIANEDGLPLLPPEYHGTMTELMRVYPSARASVMGGAESARNFRSSMLSHYVGNDILGKPEDPPTNTASDMVFLIGVERSENEWDTFDPARPFEIAVHRFVESINTGA